MDKLRYPPPGTPPATLVVPPEYQGQKPVISLIEYDAHSIVERSIETMDELLRNLHEAIEGCLSVDIAAPKPGGKQRILEIAL